MGRGKFSDERYDEIKQEVIDMFEECEIDTYPIDCFEIARKLHYVLHPYSTLDAAGYLEAITISPDAFSRVEQNSETGMFEYVIYYNDQDYNIGHIRWSIFHEIGHCVLGHHDNPPGNEEREEDEANFFAKYAMTPPPLLNVTRCSCPSDVEEKFNTSGEFSGYAYEYFQVWLHKGPRDYQDFEIRLLQLFHFTISAA